MRDWWLRPADPEYRGAPRRHSRIHISADKECTLVHNCSLYLLTQSVNPCNPIVSSREEEDPAHERFAPSLGPECRDKECCVPRWSCRSPAPRSLLFSSRPVAHSHKLKIVFPQILPASRHDLHKFVLFGRTSKHASTSLVTVSVAAPGGQYRVIFQ